jgi:hypothetical protein
MRFEDQLPKSRFGRGGQGNFLLLGELDQGRDPKRSVQMDVQIGFGNGANEFETPPV